MPAAVGRVSHKEPIKSSREMLKTEVLVDHHMGPAKHRPKYSQFVVPITSKERRYTCNYPERGIGRDSIAHFTLC